MDAGKVLRKARKRAGLTQRELSERSGIAQPTIARIETRAEEPRVGTLERLLWECGEHLISMRRGGIGIDRTLIQDLLAMTPAERAKTVVGDARMLVMIDRARESHRRRRA